MDSTLLSILACPRCRGKLTLLEKGLGCAACSLLYPLVDGIPVLLLEEAVPHPCGMPEPGDGTKTP